MQNQVLSARQMICLIILFIFGSSLVVGVSSATGQDTWISTLIAIVITIPVILMYARILTLFPGKDIYDIVITLFGKVVGKIVTVLFIWYAVHLAALVLRNFSEFIQIVVMPETPQTVLMIAMLLVTIYLAQSGIETLGRWSIIIFSIIITVIAFTVIFSINEMNFQNLMPFMGHSIQTISMESINIFSFPFAETVLFLSLSSAIRKDVSPYKIFLLGIIIGGLFLVVIILRNILSLGPLMMGSVFFPSYIAASIINIGDFMSRIEGTISVNFMLTGVTKITVCLIAASKGFSKLFNMQEEKYIILPISLLILALCTIIYSNAIEMVNFLKVYYIYAFPFQVLLPVLIWIAAEIKTRKKKVAKGAA
ncbi:endospore germination permease [Oscillospiraceae bacterium PP1C4]